MQKKFIVGMFIAFFCNIAILSGFAMVFAEDGDWIIEYSNKHTDRSVYYRTRYKVSAENQKPVFEKNKQKMTFQQMARMLVGKKKIQVSASYKRKSKKYHLN